MNKIIKGHSEDNTFLSDNIYSLLEWCLNYKKSVHFILYNPYHSYNVEIKYIKDISEGNYKTDTYRIWLNVAIPNEQGKFILDSIYIDDVNSFIEEAVKNFIIHTLIYLIIH